jgi:hypothetical protein
MEITLEQQRKAISMAIRDARRELMRTSDSEISQELAETIRGLEAAMETIKLVASLKQLVG